MFSATFVVVVGWDGLMLGGASDVLRKISLLVCLKMFVDLHKDVSDEQGGVPDINKTRGEQRTFSKSTICCQSQCSRPRTTSNTRACQYYTLS